MELHPIDGGRSSNQATARAEVATAASFVAPAPSIPWAAGVALTQLANLIDESIAVRGLGDGVREWAAQFLGIRATDIAVTKIEPSWFRSQLILLALSEDLATHTPVAMIGYDQEEPPQWVDVELGEVTARVPCWVTAALAEGSVSSAPLVVQVASPSDVKGVVVTVFARPHDLPLAEQYLAELRARSLERTNPFKDRILETVDLPQLGLSFRVVTPPPTTRHDVVLPARVWADIDRNVFGLYAALDRLRAAGLATNRGILLAGQPGTGKTALCRALAHELAGQVTVVFCNAAVVQRHVRQLYKELAHLTPALVVMEDVDLVVGDRAKGGSDSLLEFLLALDGAMSDHSGVVTIATTNDARSIDAAAKRSARFDVLIEVPPPDHGGRAEILHRYLRGLQCEIDVSAVAAATAGLSGADLRELVSDAVVHSPDVTTSLLVTLAGRRRLRPLPGLYL